MAKAQIQNPDGFAFQADYLITKHALNFRNAQIQGKLRMPGASIGGDLDCDEAVFKGADGLAMILDGASVNGDMYVRTAHLIGTLKMPGASIGGDLDFCGTHLENPGRMTQQLVCDALTMALFRRGFPRSVIVHSDRGSQYCSKRYQRLMAVHGLLCSMGRKATCYDNAAMESFFHSLKVELVHRELYVSRQQARSSIFEYIEMYYNRQRKHSAIGNQIPMQFEMRNRA